MYDIEEELHILIKTKWDCFDKGANWVVRDTNFDNLF